MRHARDAEASLTASAAMFASVLKLPCRLHSVRPTEPCWTVTATAGDTLRGV